MVKENQNKFDLPPSMFELVCERAEDPKNARDVYDVLLNEMQIQLDSTHDEPQHAAFLMIAQYALILDDIKQNVAVDENLICKECFEPLPESTGDNSCDNPKCKLYCVPVE